MVGPIGQKPHTDPTTCGETQSGIPEDRTSWGGFIAQKIETIDKSSEKMADRAMVKTIEEAGKALEFVDKHTRSPLRNQAAKHPNYIWLGSTLASCWLLGPAGAFLVAYFTGLGLVAYNASNAPR